MTNNNKTLNEQNIPGNVFEIPGIVFLVLSACALLHRLPVARLPDGQGRQGQGFVFDVCDL